MLFQMNQLLQRYCLSKYKRLLYSKCSHYNNNQQATWIIVGQQTIFANLKKENQAHGGQCFQDSLSMQNDCNESKWIQGRFSKQDNRCYKMELSKTKSVVLGVFQGNMYLHIWDMQELYHLMVNKEYLEEIWT